MEFPLRTMLLLSLGPLLAREIVQGKDIKVYQTADLEVVEGDSVTLHCCWTGANHTQYGAVWRKNEDTILHQPTAVTDNGEGCGSALSPVNNGTCGCATLTLPSVTRNHTGCYICKVTIDKPTLIQFCGNGTMITVTERRSPTNGTTQEKTFTKDDIKLYETADVEVSEGDSVTLHCGLRLINPKKYKVNWLKYKGQIPHQPTAVRYDGEGCGSALSPVNNGTCGCATLTLPNVTRNHAGRYICQVTIDRPILIQYWGNGTMITVTERRSPTNGATQKNSAEHAAMQFPVIVSLGIVMAAVFFVTLLCLWKLRKRQARVIYEVPHEDSEVDGTSTSSSKGSSQWCQVPVYESFDYFECVVESKGSG
ncbi:uncharacterized protein LOC132475922 isoform X2 [Gadus macrocephalus]|uniref:uncharacterized protein LOC132475922 isoform X2 n=1 Tax=Gadus macrocephalus TaxID=80720 RepID=UPI0028CB2BB0|nr:uncharacterized protein LOC132475922 isoform X2 [Gadus macrocephalus]